LSLDLFNDHSTIWKEVGMKYSLRYILAVFAMMLLVGCSQSVSWVVPSGAPSVIQTTPRPVDFFQQGIQVNWHTKGNPDKVAAAAQRSVDYVVGLGANSIGITVPIAVDGQLPTTVYAGPRTPTPDELGVMLQATSSKHLHTMVRPLIQVATSDGTPFFRGKIVPVNVDQWFADYTALLDTFIPKLIEYRVDEFVLGAELVYLQQFPDQWQKLYNHVKVSGYQGKLSFALNWDNFEVSGMPFTAWGVDAYPKTTLGDEATVPQLEQAIMDWYTTIPPGIPQNLVFQEVGLAAQPGAFLTPWVAGADVLTQPLRLDMQARWFEAMCNVAKNTHTRGIYYWVIDSNYDPALAATLWDPAKSWLKRPAEDAIRNCFVN
jgi:hypothetical protein